MGFRSEGLALGFGVEDFRLRGQRFRVQSSNKKGFITPS